MAYPEVLGRSARREFPLDDNTILPFVYEEVICESDDPCEAIPVLWRILCDLDPDAAGAIRKQFMYA